VRSSIVPGLTLLIAMITTVAVPASAQLPPAGSGARMPVDPGAQQPPSSGPGLPGAPGARPGKADKPDKNKKPEKFGPIAILPLQHLYFAGLGAPTAAAPAYDDARIYVALKGGTVGAWKTEDSSPVWTLQGLAVTQPLVLDSGRLYATLEAEQVALDAVSGKVLWRLPSGPVSTPPIAKGGWLIDAVETDSGDGGELRALRGETGEVVWHVKLPAALETRPIIVGDRLYVAPQNYHLIGFDLVSGQQLWSEELDEQVSSIAASEQRVFAGTRNKFFGFDHAGHMKWTRRLGAEVIGDAVTDANGVYAAFTDNTLVALGNNGELRWRGGLAYRPVSGPILVDGSIPMLLLTGIAPVIHGYAAKDGKAAPDYTPPADPRVLIYSSLMFVHGRTFFDDTVMMLFAHGWTGAARRTGPGLFSPFTDPGLVCPALSMPGEPPPPATASAPPSPPKL
jgi:outer membrane protein assembly factor BamB